MAIDAILLHTGQIPVLPERWPAWPLRAQPRHRDPSRRRTSVHPQPTALAKLKDTNICRLPCLNKKIGTSIACWRDGPHTLVATAYKCSTAIEDPGIVWRAASVRTRWREPSIALLKSSRPWGP